MTAKVAYLRNEVLQEEAPHLRRRRRHRRVLEMQKTNADPIKIYTFVEVCFCPLLCRFVSLLLILLPYSYYVVAMDVIVSLFFLCSILFFYDTFHVTLESKARLN